MITWVRRLLLVLWLVSITAILAYFFTHPQNFAADKIAERLREWAEYVLLAYFVVSVLRALAMIPSTPFVLAGGLLLPESPLLVLVISMMGIAVSASLIYFLAESLGFRELIGRIHPQSLQRMDHTLRGPRGFAFLTLWCFFPLVPTDAACYVAGTVRMPFGKYLMAVCLGEMIICSAYVYLGNFLGSLLW